MLQECIFSYVVFIKSKNIAGVIARYIIHYFNSNSTTVSMSSGSFELLKFINAASP